MESCEKFQRDLLSLTAEAFQSQNKNQLHLDKCAACKEFVDDLRVIREAPAPSWFLSHVPQVFWSELDEQIKATIYHFGGRSPYYPLRPLIWFLLGVVAMLSGVLWRLHHPLIRPSSIDWQEWYQQIERDTEYADDPTDDQSIAWPLPPLEEEKTYGIEP